MFSINLGVAAGTPDQPITHPEDDFREHMMIYGGIGQGKSKLMEHILRQLLYHRRGFCLIDPHGDLAEDLLAFIAQHPDRVSPHLRNNLYYLEPGHPEWCFSYDPFYFRGEPANFDEWLETKVDDVARSIIRMHGEADFAGARLARWLPRVLTGVGAAVDEHYTAHLSLADAQVLLAPTTQEFQEVYDVVAARLDFETQHDFENMRSRKSVYDETESTRNRLNRFLFKKVKEILSAPTRTIDFGRIVRCGFPVIANLKKADGFTREQANAIGGMLIREILGAAEAIPRSERSRYYLFVDEASRFVGDDLMQAFREVRKFGLTLCLAVQDLSALKTKDSDLRAAANSQAHVKVSFRQDNPDDCEYLGKMMAYKAFNRDRRIVEVDRFDGYEKKTTHGRQVGRSGGSGWHSGGSSTNQEASVPGGPTQRRRGTAETAGQSGSESESESESTQEVYLANYRTEERDEGLKHAPQEQVADWISQLGELPKREALLQVAEGKPRHLATVDVDESWSALRPASRQQLIEAVKTDIFQKHACYFRRSEVQIDQTTRLRAYLAAARSRERPLVIDVPSHPAVPHDALANLDATDDPESPFDL